MLKKHIHVCKRIWFLFGLIFQIIDDLIDEKDFLKKLGETPGKDKNKVKVL